MSSQTQAQGLVHYITPWMLVAESQDCKAKKKQKLDSLPIFTPLQHTYQWAYCNPTYWSRGTKWSVGSLETPRSWELIGYSTSTVLLASQGSKAKEWWLSGHTLQRRLLSLHQWFCARNLRIHPRGWNERLPRVGELIKSFKNHLKEITPLWNCSLQTDTKIPPPTRKICEFHWFKAFECRSDLMNKD